MEQKRTLWIIASVGIFLLVVLGGMLIFYKPQAQNMQTVAQVSQTTRQTSSGWINPPVDSNSSNRSESLSQAAQSENGGVVGGQGNETAVLSSAAQNAQTMSATQSDQQMAMQTQNGQAVSAQTQNETARPSVANVGDMTVYSQNTTVYGAVATNGANAQRTEVAGGTVIDLNAPRGATESDAALASAASETSQRVARATDAPAQSATVTRTNAASSNTRTASASATRTTSASAATTTAKTATAPAAKAQTTTTQYWVQAASFASKNGADNARGTLDSNKIPSDIFTYKDNNGNVFYRVRVGPYTTKSEAEYWRTRVAQISDFSTTESYVTQTTTVN